MSGSSPVIVLRDGPALPLEALQLALDLEHRGCRLRLDSGGSLLAGPSELLTPDDRTAIRRWRSHLIAIVEHCEKGTAQ